MPLYYLLIRSEQLEGELFLNGAPIYRLRRFVRTAVQVSHWIVYGENKIEARIERVTPSDESSDAPLGRLVFELREGSVGDTPGEDPSRMLCAIHRQLTSDQLPSILSAEATVVTGRPPWRWETCERLEPADRQWVGELRDFIAEVHRVFIDKDLPALERLVAFTFDEVAGVYGYTEQDARAGFRSSYEAIFRDDDYSVADLDLEQLDLRTACEARVVQVRNVNDVPTIRSRGYDGEGGWFLPMFVGRIDGQWQIVR